MWSTGIVKKPWIWPGVEIHRQDAVGAGELEHVGDEAAGDRLARLRLAVLARVREPAGSTAVIRLAEASFAAWIMNSSSIRLRSTGGQPSGR